MRPWLDVSSVILSGDFADAVSIIRREETVSDLGVSSTVKTEFARVIGVVTQAGPNDLARLPEYGNAAGVICFITKFRLRGPAKDGLLRFQPDIVFWNGNHYVVRTLDPYTRYGAGFMESICEMTDYVGTTEQS